MRFKTIVRSPAGELIEGFISGDMDDDNPCLNDFTITAIEGSDGEPLPVRPFEGWDAEPELTHQLEEAVREHDAENVRIIDGDRPYRVPLGDRLVDVYVSKINLPRNGYFDPFKSIVDPPEGGSADIKIIRDAQTDETIDLDTIPEDDYELLVERLVEEARDEEARAERDDYERCGHEPDNWLDEAI